MFDRRARIPAAPDTGAWHVLSLVSRRVLISAVWSRLDANYQLTFVRQGQPVSQDTLPASDWLPGHSPALWLADVTGLGTPWNLSPPAWPLSVTVQVSGVGSVSCCHERDTWQCHDQCPGHLSHVSRALRARVLMTMATAAGSMSPMFQDLIISWQQEDGDQSGVTTGVTRLSWHSSQVVTKTLAALHSYR